MKSDNSPKALNELIPAAAYLRMSSDDQATSIEQQRKDVKAYAERQGYRIVAWYVDEGLSGSKDTEKRIQFNRLLADCSKNIFKVILCWDHKRFTREEQYDISWAKRTLQKNNILLDYVADGKVDFTTFEGRIKDFLKTEEGHADVRGLTMKMVRGRQDAFDRGECANGQMPMGYARRYSYGNMVQVVKRTESFRKPRGWKTEVIVDDEEKENILFIFKTFAERDISRRELLMILAEKGIPTPRGERCWHDSGLRYLLTNKAYIGISEVGGDGRKPAQFARLRHGERTDIFPSIIDRELWDAVQRKLARRTRDRTAPKANSYSPLCGLVYCGKCNSRMSRETAKKHAGKYVGGSGKTYHRTNETCYLRYKCNTPNKQPGKGCRGWGVADADLLPRLIELLIAEIDKELLNALAITPEQQLVSDIEMREKHRQDLAKEIDKATERYLTAPPNIMPMLEQKITTWQEQLATLETECTAP